MKTQNWRDAVASAEGLSSAAVIFPSKEAHEKAAKAWRGAQRLAEEARLRDEGETARNAGERAKEHRQKANTYPES